MRSWFTATYRRPGCVRRVDEEESSGWAVRHRSSASEQRIEAKTLNVERFETFGAHAVAQPVALCNPQRLERRLDLRRKQLSAKVLHEFGWEIAQRAQCPQALASVG